MFQLNDVSFSYVTGQQSFPALHHLNLTLPAHELICLAGPSGSGKTTLLSLLGLVEDVQKGDILFNGQSYASADEKQKTSWRQHSLGFVFQNFLLFDVLTAKENVEYFLRSGGKSESESAKIAVESLARVGLGDFVEKRPTELSGGQRQRVAIARALAKGPQVIIADEPTASLDQKSGEGVMKIFAELAAQKAASIVFSSHDPMAQSFANQTVQLKDGRLC